MVEIMATGAFLAFIALRCGCYEVVRLRICRIVLCPTESVVESCFIDVS